MTKTNKPIALFLVMLMVFAMLPAMAFAGNEEQVKRLSGPDRYATSVAVAKAAYPDGVDNIIIARGDDQGQWADGLAASFLAGVLDAPILLTSPDSLPAVVASAIADDLKPDKAYILGGTGAVSAEVQASLSGLGLEVERIAGAGREATAVEIAKKGGSSFDTAFVVQGRAPADSMVAGAKAFSDGIPILLVNRDLPVPDVTANAIDDLNVENIIIVGGSGVVSGEVEAALSAFAGVGNVTRLAGANRIATSVVFAEGQFSNPAEFSIVNGFRGLADAVGAAVFGVPILYVNSIPEAVEDYLEVVVTANSIFRIFGGTAVVGAAVADELKAIISEAPDFVRVMETSPADGALDVNIDSEITVKFDRVVEETASFNDIEITSNGNAVDYETSLNAVLTLIPLENLEIDTEYTVTIPAGAVADAADASIEMQHDYSFSFTILDPTPFVESVVTENEGAQASASIGPNGEITVKTANRGEFGNEWSIEVIVPTDDNTGVEVDINFGAKTIKVTLYLDGDTNKPENRVFGIADAINEEDERNDFIVEYGSDDNTVGITTAEGPHDFTGGENIELLVTWNNGVELEEFFRIRLDEKDADQAEPLGGGFHIAHTLGWDDAGLIDEATELEIGAGVSSLFYEGVEYFNKAETWRYEAMTGEWQPYLGN